jgi:hypothetical protein
VSLNKSLVVGADGKDRSDMLGERGLDGEVADVFVDYKEEAIKAFVNIIELSKTPEVEGEEPPAAAKGKGQEAEPEEKPQKYTTFSQLLEVVGTNRLNNVLATFSLEYAESRGNLNKEQAFFYLALFQYAQSRQDLMGTYLKASTEKHPDVQRMRQCSRIAADFSQFTSPYLPSNFHATKKQLHDASKPVQIVHQFFQLDEMKESLPHSAAYLVLQLSDDEQYIFCGVMAIDKARKVTYHVTKLNLSGVDREALFKMISTLAQNKLTMQKAPITIEEDLVALEKDSNEEITKLLEQLEAFFEPISKDLDGIINPVFDAPEDDADAAQAPAKGGKADAKKDDKKAAKPPAKGKGAADAQLAAYESNLPVPSSGIESLILLIDSKLESLPLESLKVFEGIPVLSRDFNLHMYMQRLKALGH